MSNNGEVSKVEQLLEKIVEQNDEILEQNDEILEKLDNMAKGGDGYGFETDIFN